MRQYGLCVLQVCVRVSVDSKCTCACVHVLHVCVIVVFQGVPVSKVFVCE